MKKVKSKPKQSKIALDAIFCVNGEMIEGRGEDSYAFSSDDGRVMTAVFDGCGGIGARRYSSYGGQTGAYVASRAVGGAVGQWFESGQPCERLIDYINSALAECERGADKNESRLLGSLGKRFPTTAAIMIFTVGSLPSEILCLWAGDSRCYCLDANGLHQLSADDVAAGDVMSNLRDDGVLTNVINSSEPFELHCAKYRLEQPCILFTATDGCFGYVPTPMEFEYLLLASLEKCRSMNEWQEALNNLFLEYSSDDYTFCAAAAGFGNYKKMAAQFAPRTKALKSEYIDKLGGRTDRKEELWTKYSVEYLKYLNN